MARCVSCGKTLCPDEIAVTKKLVNRGAVSFYCVNCLAVRFSVTPEEIRESMAISTDLKTWASAEAWNLQDDSSVDITDVKFDFDPATVKEGSSEITFATQGREYKVETTARHEVGDRVGLDFDPEDIHVMHKEVADV